MDFTPRLQLPYIAPQQAQKQVTYNEAMRMLDLLVQPAVKSRSLAVPPAGAAEGDSHIVAPGAGGEWAGKEQQIATRLDGGWQFRAAAKGWMAYVEDAAELAVFGDGSWTSFASNGGTTIAKFGINAGADLTNRLVVAADASLFNHDGSDHRLKLNKASGADTASVLFQAGFSGRAEFGIAGDDNFHMKVSADGSGWLEALVLDAASGLVRLPQGQLAFPPTSNPSGDAHTLDDYAEGEWVPALAFGGAAVGIGYGAATTGRFTKVGRLCTASGTLVLTSKGSSSGAAVITGLPYASPAGNVSAASSIAVASNFSGIAGAVSGLQLAGSSGIALSHANDGATAALSEANFSDSSELRFTVSYEAA